MLASALIKDIPNRTTFNVFCCRSFNRKSQVYLIKPLNKNKTNLTDQNIFIFGIKPTSPSSEYGYFLTKKVKGNINKVTKFIEKPKEVKAKQVISQKGYWNSGMFFLRKDSIINNFKKYQPTIYRNCVKAVSKAKLKNNTYYLNKASFEKAHCKIFRLCNFRKNKANQRY